MKNVPFILSDTSVTVVVGGKPYTTSSANANFNEIRSRIAAEQFDGIEELFDTGAAVGVYTKGNIVVKDGVVLYKGEPVHNHVVDRILDFMCEGISYKPLVNFLDKLLQNPSRRAVQELYTFLEHKNMALTPSGNFLAYKSVKSDYTDHRTGTFKNTIGAVIEMPRNQVCDDANIACSVGFHAGSLEYAKSFGGSSSILLIVEINPADATSVPLDANCQKLRTSKYKVVGTFERPLDEPLVTQYSTPAEIEAAEDAEFEQLVKDSYSAGFETGEYDAISNASYDEDYAYEYEDSNYDYESYCDGYYDGFEQNKIVKPVAKIKPSTRAKLSKAAKKQKRNSSGRFV